MTENLYIVSAYGDYCGVDAATLISIPDEHCCDAEAIEYYLNADPDLCVKADARLIAAAPDLLETLEYVLLAADYDGALTLGTAALSPAIRDRIVRTLAKVHGEETAE